MNSAPGKKGVKILFKERLYSNNLLLLSENSYSILVLKFIICQFIHGKITKCKRNKLTLSCYDNDKVVYLQSVVIM